VRKFKEFIKSVLGYIKLSPIYELFVNFIGLGTIYDERSMEVLLESVKFLNQRLACDIFREMSHSKNPHSVPFVTVLECLKFLSANFRNDFFESAKEKAESMKFLVPELPFKHYLRTEQMLKVIVESFNDSKANASTLNTSEQLFFTADVSFWHLGPSKILFGLSRLTMMGRWSGKSSSG
jgi:hypothetical protein